MTKVLASATIFSLFADPPAALPAPIPGSEGALDAAVLVGESDRLDVAIRRFSAAGAVLSLPAALEPGEAWILELRNGQCIEGSVAWATGTEAGFAFARTIDVVGILARNLAILPAERRSVPRVELRQIVGIRCGGEFELARARDISQAGVGIDTALHLAPDDEVQIAFDGLPASPARCAGRAATRPASPSTMRSPGRC
ncbi:MAG: PilZ domain-containing protein [Sphingomonas sp.]